MGLFLQTTGEDVAQLGVGWTERVFGPALESGEGEGAKGLDDG